MQRRVLLPLLFGASSVPAIVLLHEFGHFAAGAAVGLNPRLTYTTVDFRGAPESLSRWDPVLTAAGPCVELLLSVLGLLWLWRSRSRRPSSTPTPFDWLATSMALASSRWLRCFTGTPSNPKPTDEAFLSQVLGFPSYLLPYALAPLAVIGITYTFRQHPEGMRLKPFALWSIGGLAGFVAWFYVIGPLLLPRS